MSKRIIVFIPVLLAAIFLSACANSNAHGTNHIHKWEPIYETIHHEEIGHYEPETWYENRYEKKLVCCACGEYFDTVDEASDHIISAHDGLSAYKYEMVLTDTIEHESETKEVWVVDQKAYDVEVIVGYQCKCGATKE